MILILYGILWPMLRLLNSFECLGNLETIYALYSNLVFTIVIYVCCGYLLMCMYNYTPEWGDFVLVRYLCLWWISWWQRALAWPRTSVRHCSVGSPRSSLIGGGVDDPGYPSQEEHWAIDRFLEGFTLCLWLRDPGSPHGNLSGQRQGFDWDFGNHLGGPVSSRGHD